MTNTGLSSTKVTHRLCYVNYFTPFSGNVSLGHLWLDEIRCSILILESFRFENESDCEYEIIPGAGEMGTSL